MSDISKESNRLEEFLKLRVENPELPIVCMVASEIVADDGFAYWLGGIGGAKIEEVFLGEERFHFKSTDEDEAVNAFIDSAIYSEGITSDEEFWDKYNALPWKKVIALYIELPD